MYTDVHIYRAYETSGCTHDGAHTQIHSNTAHNIEPMASQAEKHLLKLMIAIASRHVMVSMSPTFLFPACLVV